MLKLAGGAAQAPQPEVATRLAARHAGGRDGGFAALLDAGSRAAEPADARPAPARMNRGAGPASEFATPPRHASGEAGGSRPAGAAEVGPARRQPPADAASHPDRRLPGDPTSASRAQEEAATGDGAVPGQAGHGDAASVQAMADGDARPDQTTTGDPQADLTTTGELEVDETTTGDAEAGPITPVDAQPGQASVAATPPGPPPAASAPPPPPLPLADGQGVPTMPDAVAAATQPMQPGPAPEAAPRANGPGRTAPATGAALTASPSGEAVAAAEPMIEATGGAAEATAFRTSDAAAPPDAATPADGGAAGPDLPLPTPGAAPAGTAPAAAMPAPPAAPPPLAQPHAAPEPPRLPAGAVQQLAARIVRASGGEVTSIAVDLRPPELGRVSLRVTFQDGAVHVAVAAARPETLAALQNDRALLTQQLEQAGINLAGGSLDFSQGNLPQQAPARDGAAGSMRGDGPAATGEPTDPAPRRSRSDSLFDLFA